MPELITWTTDDINATADTIREYLKTESPDMERLLFNQEIEEIAMRVWPIVEARTRERIAGYLSRSAQKKRRSDLLGDVVTGNQLAEAAEWCRDETIWDTMRDGGDR